MPYKVRPIKIEDDVAYVTLTQGHIAIINTEDVPIVEGRNWCVLDDGWNVYAMRGQNFNGKLRTIYMHRVIAGAEPGQHVDHIDGNALNNLRSNIRICTHAENQKNRRNMRSNTSGFKGVTWSKKARKWQAQISVKNRNQYLGSFDTPEKAHQAYCEASKKYHGEYGRTE